MLLEDMQKELMYEAILRYAKTNASKRHIEDLLRTNFKTVPEELILEVVNAVHPTKRRI